MEHVEIWGKGDANVRLVRTYVNPGNYEFAVRAAKPNNESKAAAKALNGMAQSLRGLGVTERQLIVTLARVLADAKGWFLLDY